ncbi:MAG: type I restriction-modification system subunit M N-terminal domain-containing protein [Micropruina sp.]
MSGTTFWSGGISNPLEVIEQITYLLFLRRLDDRQKLAENKARLTGSGRVELGQSSSHGFPGGSIR